jgi:phage repressor protein C with HTH and peptisase S24 domain
MRKKLERQDFKTRIKNLRDALDQTQAELAEKVGIPRSSLANYEKGISVPPGDFISALKIVFNVNLDWFLTGEGEMFLASAPSPQGQELVKQETVLEYATGTGHKRLPAGAFVVPLLDQRLSAGNGSYLPEEDEAKALIHVPSYLARYGDQIKALEVDGDSMYPTLHRGDMVVCDSCGWSGEGIYALRMGGSGYVKRLTKKPGKIVIISDNPKYPFQEEPEESEDIEIIGRVHCAITKIE